MKLISQEWLDRANDDLSVIKEIIGRDDLTNMVAFHSQQAVEKMYKAIMEEFEIDFIKTHKLEILNESVKNVIHLDTDIEILQRLDEVYTSARYPSELGILPYGKPSGEDAKLFSNYALSMFNQIKTRLGESTGPNAA